MYGGTHSFNSSKKKGIRQGAVTSPPLFNNTVIVPQQNDLTTRIFNGIDVSLANYADDIIDISRTAFGIEENFGILDREYKRIGLRFNESKTETCTSQTFRLVFADHHHVTGLSGKVSKLSTLTSSNDVQRNPEKVLQVPVIRTSASRLQQSTLLPRLCSAP